MPVVRFALSDEYYERLMDMAQEEGVTVQDYIRNCLFEENSIFTPKEAVRRALKRHKEDPTFTLFSLPELYGDEWVLTKGPAGAFGKNFYNYIKEGHCKIVFDGVADRRARYKILTD